MAFIVIKRTDANAVRASDLLQALNTSDQLFARVEVIHNRMQQMTPAEVETIFGVEAGVGAALKTTIADLFAYLSDPAEAFEQFRSKLG